MPGFPSLAERILSRKAGRSLRAGQVDEFEIDLALTHEVLGPPTFRTFETLGVPLWNPDRVYVTIDHFVPAATVAQAENNRAIIAAVQRHGITHTGFYDGPSHQTLAESGLAGPGDVVVGTDSHTCTAGALGSFATGIGGTEMAGVLATGKLWLKVPHAISVRLTGSPPTGVSAKDVVLYLLRDLGMDGATYASLEFGGPGVRAMPMDERLVLANMAVELGAKVGLVEVDETTWRYVGREPEPGLDLTLHDGTDYSRRITVELSALEPLCAAPHSPANVRPVADVAGVVIQQAYIGSCTGGRLTDYRSAAQILRHRRVASSVRLIITPASKVIYRAMLAEGLLEIFAAAGAIVEPPGCGPCAGLQAGVLADGETAITASSRNFVGRMGSAGASIYLASPATVAASATTGMITDPRGLLSADEVLR
ncbi:MULTISPECIES: 3-isopropylmalate dehydratase large subunit [unclassified Frankia]|uniref:3-isopropylmalate dehydratase large subunit n=1 Tax=unclassified Frankia TaxID=2632575 RepID=UPI001EF6FEC4|nr:MULTISPECIES: 3-isopropylmalate dehydratase large subunit [unclassified Frankia]